MLVLHRLGGHLALLQPVKKNLAFPLIPRLQQAFIMARGWAAGVLRIRDPKVFPDGLRIRAVLRECCDKYVAQCFNIFATDDTKIKYFGSFNYC